MTIEQGSLPSPGAAGGHVVHVDVTFVNRNLHDVVPTCWRFDHWIVVVVFISLYIYSDKMEDNLKKT